MFYLVIFYHFFYSPIFLLLSFYQLIYLITNKRKDKIENVEEGKTPQEEIVKDIMSIMNVYVAKINGLRKYKKIIKHKIITK